MFFNIYIYVLILETNKTLYIYLPQISRHAIRRREINLFFPFSDSIHEVTTDIEISQTIENDLQGTLALLIIDYFEHNLGLNAQARKFVDHNWTHNSTKF